MGSASQNSTLPRLPFLSSTRPWTSPYRPRPSQPTPQPLTPSLSNLPVRQTPGCRSVHNRSALSPSHPVLKVPYPHCTLEVSENHSLWQPPLSRWSGLSCATLSQCSCTGLSQGHGRKRSSGGLVSCAAPR